MFDWNPWIFHASLHVKIIGLLLMHKKMSFPSSQILQNLWEEIAFHMCTSSAFKNNKSDSKQDNAKFFA